MDTDTACRTGNSNAAIDGYTKLFDQAPCGIGLFSSSMGQRAVYLNKTYYELIGYSREEYEKISGDPVSALIYPEDLPLVQRLFDGPGKAAEAEYRIVTKSGRLMWIKLNISSVTADDEPYIFASFVDISKEKELSDQLELVAGNVEYSISILRVEGNERFYLEYANDTFEKLTGYASEQFASDAVGYAMRAVGNDVFDNIRPCIEKALETGQPQVAEYPFKRKDGRTIWLRRQFSVIALPEPGSYRLLSVTGDITQRHNAEETLKNIISYIPAGIIVYRVDGKNITVEEANPSVCAIMGIERETVLGYTRDTLFDHVHPDDLINVRRAADRLSAPGNSVHYEYRCYNSLKKAYIWLSADGRSIEIQDGAVNVYISYVDMTPQKTAEEEIVLRDDALRIADKSLCAGTIINRLGMHKPLLYISDNFENFLGYTKAEFLQMYEDQYVRVIHPEDYARVIELNNKHAAERTPAYEMQFRFVRKDGSVFWALEKGTFIEKFRGEPAFLSVFIDISEQKRSEQALFERNAMFDILLENSNLSLWTYDIAGKTAKLISSKKHERPISYDCTPNFPESVIATGYVKKDSIPTVRALLARVDAGEPVVSDDVWYAPKNGDPWCDRVTYVNIRNDEGEIIRTVSIAEDVTEHRLAQQQFEEELKYQQNLQSENLLAKVRCNLTKNVIERYIASDEISIWHDNMPYDKGVETLSLTGYTVIERDRLLHLFNAQRVTKAFEQGQSFYSIDYRRTGRDGRVRWMNSSVKTYRDMQTGDIKSFMYTTDISKEHMLQDIIDEVTKIDYDYIGYIDALNDKYVLFSSGDKNAPLPPASQAYAEGIATYTARYVPEEDAADVLEMMSMERVLAELEKKTVYVVPVKVRGFGGEIHQKQLKYFYLNRENKQVIITRTDITDVICEQQRQQELLRTALVQAELASNAKSDFLSKMSHEIRTPMNAIIGMNTIAAQNINDQEAVGDCISKVGISARYLLTLINDILDMSRIESGKLTLRNEEIPFEEFINGINTVIYEQAAEKSISYDSIITGFVAQTYLGDAMKLQQVLINLLGNAIKFTPPGGKVQLIISQERTEGKTAHMRFTVNDTGCGISEEFQKQMFEPFEQEQNGATSQYGGTGLGLAISKNLVQLMRGSISTSSIVGVGTEFTVNIPLGIVQDKYGAEHCCQVPFAKMKALVVDDEILICEQVKATLCEIGLKAEWVTSGYQAVELVKEKWKSGKYFDIILVDWKMPDMDGIETARQVRHIVGPDVTIIIITAYEWAGIEKEAREAGVNMLITKPLFKTSLISTFERIFVPKLTQEQERPKKKEYDFSGKRALLVEDHLLNVEVAKRLLEAKHLKVDVAENGLAAIEAYAQTPVGYYDVILMDIRMPVMDGLTAARSIRQMKKPTAKTIPIIAMSANAFDEDLEKSRLAGMNAHLSKPIEPDSLYSTLAEYIIHAK